MAHTGIIDKSKKRVLTPKAAGALFLALSFSAVFYAVLHYIHVEGVAHPGVIMLMPVSAIVWLLLLVPLFMFIAYQDDFKNLNPLLPHHYLFIARRCFKAMKDNDFKVSEKNL